MSIINTINYSTFDRSYNCRVEQQYRVVTDSELSKRGAKRKIKNAYKNNGLDYSTIEIIAINKEKLK